MSTPMGKALAGKPAGASRFESAISSSRVLVPFTIPGINLPCLMSIVGSERYLDLDGESRRACEERGYKETSPQMHYLVQDKYEIELARFVLAEACRDADPKTQPDPPPCGTREQWGKLSVEVIAACWIRYNELRAQYDPLADDATVNTLEMLEIREAVSKKNGQLLRSFGLQKLTAYLLTTGVQPSNSPTLKSEDGLTSSDSSSGSEPEPTEPAHAPT